jgi:hypothetical protein
MAANIQDGSATIYQFPARGRYAAAMRERERDASVQPANIVYGSGWYHDEAIEAERARKN